MKNIIILISVLSIIIISIIAINKQADSSSIEKNLNISNKSASTEYLSLLKKFPIENQGLSNEPVLEPKGLSEQPMTYGLILSSESLHYKAKPNEESAERIKNAVKWIIDNSDLDNDGYPGWGLPQSYDAFADGTINPENQPYTVTTAIVLEGLLDALKNETLWSKQEELEIKNLIANTISYWCKDIYFGDEKSGYFLYSSKDASYYSPNVTGIFLSSMVRATKEYHDIFNETEKKEIIMKTHALTTYLVNTVSLEQGFPIWDYYSHPYVDVESNLNDPVHHIYILWGIEEYRKYFNEVNIPFTLEDSINSVNAFWKDEKVYSFPQYKIYTGKQESFNDRPSNLWGIGMMLAFYEKYDTQEMADKVLNNINVYYGPIPNLKMWPTNFIDDNNFYERYAAHVLFGLSYRDFY